MAYKFEQLTKEISKVEEELKEVKTTIKQLFIKERNANEDKFLDYLIAKEAELSAEKTGLQEERKLLHHQIDWNFNQFMDWFNKICYVCAEKCSASSTVPNQVLSAKLDKYYSFELMNKYRNAFENFKQRINNKFFEKRIRPITTLIWQEDALPILISSHDDLCSNLATVLTESIKTLFPNIKNLSLALRPNGADEYSDLYYKIKIKDNDEYVKCVAEVKTKKQVDFNVINIIDEIKKKDSNLRDAISQTACQLLETKVPKALLLTCYDYTYFLYLDDESRTVEISPIIERVEFFEAVLLVLSLSFKPISEELDFNFDNFKADFTNQTTPRNSLSPKDNQNTSTLNGNSRYELISNSKSSNSANNNLDSAFNEKLDDSGDSGVSFNGDDFTEEEIMEARKDRTFIGYGSCGIVSRIHIKGHSYADKCCSVFKQSTVKDLKNEYEILMELNNNKTLSEKFFPRVYFNGETYGTTHIVMDFIEGRTYNDFNQVSDEEKQQCLKRVDQLHAIRLLHGDLRAPNFIMTPNGVFIIDFGRSRFINPGEEEKLELEKNAFRLLANV